MECMSFRTTILADPGCNDDAIVEHAAECRQCGTCRRDLRRFSFSLDNAIKIPLPESLQAKILLRQSSRPNRIVGWRTASALGVCAMIAVIAIAIGHRIETANSPSQWAEAVEHYIERTVVTASPIAAVSHQDVNEMLKQIGVHLDESLGSVAIATPCIIGNRRGAHLVVRGDDGPVSVLIMPEAELQQEIEFKTTNISGVIAPCPRGSIAVVGYVEEPIGKIRSQFERAITFI